MDEIQVKVSLPKGLVAAIDSFNESWPDTVITASHCSDPSGLRLKVDGILDHQDSTAFLSVASLALREVRGSGSLVIDLSSLNHISSLGVASFVRLLIEARDIQVPLFLAGMAENIRIIFEVLGFSSFFMYLAKEDVR